MIWRRLFGGGRTPGQPTIPRAPEAKRKAYVQFSEPVGLSERDWQILLDNERRVMLAYHLGLDLALHRGAQRPEWLISGDEPSASNGFVVVRNQDA